MRLIYDFLSNNKFHIISEFEDKIYKEAAIRLYRNQNISEHATKLAKAKLMRIHHQMPLHIWLEKKKKEKGKNI